MKLYFITSLIVAKYKEVATVLKVGNNNNDSMAMFSKLIKYCKNKKTAGWGITENSLYYRLIPVEVDLKEYKDNKIYFTFAVGYNIRDKYFMEILGVSESKVKSLEFFNKIVTDRGGKATDNIYQENSTINGEKETLTLFFLEK